MLKWIAYSLGWQLTFISLASLSFWSKGQSLYWNVLLCVGAMIIPLSKFQVWFGATGNNTSCQLQRCLTPNGFPPVLVHWYVNARLGSRLFSILQPERLRAYIASLRRGKITRQQGKRRQHFTIVAKNFIVGYVQLLWISWKWEGKYKRGREDKLRQARKNQFKSYQQHVQIFHIMWR